MTEPEKLHAGLEYDMWAPEIDALKLRAMTLCRRLNALPKEAKDCLLYTSDAADE